MLLLLSGLTKTAMNNKLLLLIAIGLLSTSSLLAQHKNWGVGLRLGDPVGISVKRYVSRQKAVEFNIGRTWGYNYSNAFYRHNNYNRDFYDYEWHQLRSSVSLQGRYLIHKDLGVREIPGLDWYYGMGAQLRVFNVDYRYRYYPTNEKKQGITRTDRVTHTDIGLDGIIGLEYSWREVPITVFADVNLFLEILDDPFLPALQGGAGFRYYF